MPSLCLATPWTWLSSFGIALYELFGWLANAGGDGSSFRNISSVFIIILGVYVAHDLVIRIARVIDDDNR